MKLIQTSFCYRFFSFLFKAGIYVPLQVCPGNYDEWHFSALPVSRQTFSVNTLIIVGFFDVSRGEKYAYRNTLVDIKCYFVW